MHATATPSGRSLPDDGDRLLRIRVLYCYINTVIATRVTASQAIGTGVCRLLRLLPAMTNSSMLQTLINKVLTRRVSRVQDASALSVRQSGGAFCNLGSMLVC